MDKFDWVLRYPRYAESLMETVTCPLAIMTAKMSGVSPIDLDTQYKESVGCMHNLLGEDTTHKLLDEVGVFPILAVNSLLEANYFERVGDIPNLGPVFLISIVDVIAINLAPTMPEAYLKRLLNAIVDCDDITQQAVEMVDAREMRVTAGVTIH